MKKITSVLTSKTCTDQSRSTKQRTTLIRRYSLLKSFLSKVFFQKDFKSIFSFQISFLVLVFLCQDASESVRENTRTMLYESAEQGNLQGVRAAIEQGGATPDYKGHNPYVYRFLALTYAVEFKDSSILKLLLESGIHPDKKTNKNARTCFFPISIERILLINHIN